MGAGQGVHPPTSRPDGAIRPFLPEPPPRQRRGTGRLSPRLQTISPDPPRGEPNRIPRLPPPGGANTNIDPESHRKGVTGLDGRAGAVRPPVGFLTGGLTAPARPAEPLFCLG